MSVARWLVAALVMTSTARADMEAPANILQNCHGPTSWAELEKCVRLANEGFKLQDKPDSKLAFAVAANNRADRYLFYQRNDGKWALGTRLFDQRFEVDQPRTIQIGHSDGVWIDLHHYQTDGIDLVLQRIALICPTLQSCSQVIYECTHVTRGRTRETFRGNVNVGAEGQITVSGDRTQGGSRC